MKVAVVGCGAVGSYYGALLARAGHDVHFLLRSDYETVRRQGVLIRSLKGDFRVRPKAAHTPEEIGRSELVLIALKTTANDQFSRLLPPLVGQGTALITLQNGLGNEEQLARWFPVDSILGGLCFVCLNRIEPGLIHHLDHGQIVIGEHQRPPELRTHQIADRFRHAGVPCSVTPNLARSHWEKLIWNIPFNGLGVAGVAGFDAVLNGELAATAPPEHLQKELRPGTSAQLHASMVEATFPPGGTPRLKCLTTECLLGDPRWAGLVRELMTEVIVAARALGHDVADSLLEQNIQRTRSMGPYKASTLIDFERGMPLELQSLFLEPLRQARAAGAKAPRLEALCRILSQLASASGAE